MSERTDADRERLLAVERVLHETRFAHPHVRATRVDEFYAALHAKECAAVESLRRRVTRVLRYALERRTHWAHAGDEIGAARAVAYQSIAGDLQRVLDQTERET